MVKVGRGTPLPTASATNLVEAGPYRFLRNPMAAAGIGQGFFVGCWLGNPLVVIFALAGIPVWHCVVRPLEEADMLERYGDAYQRYRGRVPLWLPRSPSRAL
ncbi:MAG: isoprenylcysteine carboxylmethyltransferase family protein [Planctomycetales bacterium]|nr:isoprenylcysteine carboxylmethyltransferase family protein [Planctomycetales bacterium]